MKDTELSHQAFSSRLRSCAETVGSVTRLSQLSGVHRNTLNRYLKDTEPDRETLIKLARAAGKPPEWLATGFTPEPSGASGSTVQSLPSGISKRLAQVVKDCGTPEGFGDVTGLSTERVAEILAGGDIWTSELLRVCHSTKTPVSWLLLNAGFDHDDLIYAGMAAETLIAEMQLVEESRPGFRPFRSKKSGWGEASLRPVFSLWTRIFSRLTPGNYEIFEVRDAAMSPTMEPNDLAVVLLDAEPTIPGVYLLRKGDAAYFARALAAGGVTSYSFDNPNYRRDSFEKGLSSDPELRCAGRVVAVYGQPN